VTDEKRCSRPIGWFYGRYVEPDGGHPKTGAKVLSCNQWSCPECRERKAKTLMARAMKGRIVARAKKEGFREKYNYKMLTLTAPGKEWRSVITAHETGLIMRDAFRKMVDRMRKHLGEFDYLRVQELQRDGYPHYHVILVGDGIAAKWVLSWIECMWREDYQMGFVKLNVLRGNDQGVAQAVKYVLKYLFKKPQELPALRLFANSSGAIERTGEKDKVWFEGHFRYCRDRSFTYQMLEELTNRYLKKGTAEWMCVYGDTYFELTVAERKEVDYEEAWMQRNSEHCRDCLH